MKGFESFEVRGWLDGALTIWTDAIENVAESISKVKSRAASSIVIAVAATGLMSIATGDAKAQVVESIPALVAGVSQQVDQRDEVPDEYWVKLLTKMKHWAPAAGDDDDIELPLAPF